MFTKLLFEEIYYLICFYKTGQIGTDQIIGENILLNRFGYDLLGCEFECLETNQRCFGFGIDTLVLCICCLV